MFRIHELHHHVIASWQELKNNLPQVVTLDHHTDILPAFMRYAEKNQYPADAGINLEQDIKRLRRFRDKCRDNTAHVSVDVCEYITHGSNPWLNRRSLGGFG